MNHILALGSIGPWEIALVFLVLLLLFGAKRLPDIARGLGKGIREFKGAVKETKEEIQSSIDDKEKPNDSSNSNKK
jgi:sec-independent protein translocase protein TatA